MARSVFISHAAEDKARAARICAALEQSGIQCWIAPRDIEPGDPWAASIVKALAEAKVMLVLLSAQSNASPQIPREIELADARKVPVLTVRLQDVEPAGALEYYLRNRHWIDVFLNPEETEAKVVGAVQRRLGVEVAPVPVPTAPRRRRWGIALFYGVAALVVMVMGVYLWSNFNRPAEPTGSAPQSVSEKSDPKPAAQNPDLRPAGIFESTRASVVRIHLDGGGFGTAFFVTAEGHLLTADYCVKGNGPFRITTHDGGNLTAELIGVSEESKLAVLRARPSAKITPLSFRHAAPSADENVLVVGTTVDELITYQQGVVRGAEGDMISAAFARFATAGLGGGPVIDQQGKVTGVYYQRQLASNPSGGSIRLFLSAPAAVAALRRFGVWVKPL